LANDDLYIDRPMVKQDYKYDIGTQPWEKFPHRPRRQGALFEDGIGCWLFSLGTASGQEQTKSQSVKAEWLLNSTRADRRAECQIAQRFILAHRVSKNDTSYGTGKKISHQQ